MSYSFDDIEYAIRDINGLIDSGLNRSSLHIAVFYLEKALKEV